MLVHWSLSTWTASKGFKFLRAIGSTSLHSYFCLKTTMLLQLLNLAIYSILNGLPPFSTSLCKKNLTAVLFSVWTQNVTECVAHFLVTEKAKERQISTLLRILRHMGADVPPELEALAENSMKGREQEKRNRLCSYLKAFGRCLWVKSFCILFFLSLSFPLEAYFPHCYPCELW